MVLVTLVAAPAAATMVPVDIPSQATQTAAFRDGVRFERALQADFKLGVHLPAAAVTELYQRACEASVPMACRWRWWRRPGAGLQPRHGVTLRNECSAGDSSACLVLGMLAAYRFRAGHPSRRDRVRDAATLLASACQGGRMLGCALWPRLAMKLGHRLHSTYLPTISRACHAGSGRACGRLALIRSAGTVLPHDPVAAARLAKRACGLGHGLGCKLQADLLMRKIAAPPVQEVAALYAMACDRGERSGCLAAAQLHLHGVGVSRDRQSFVNLASRACRLGLSSACRRLHIEGAAVPADSPWRPVTSDTLQYGTRLSTRSYGGGLAAAYIGGALLAPFTGGLALLTPSIVHAANGQAVRAIVAPLGIAGCSVGGAFGGGLLGVAMGGDAFIVTGVMGLLGGYVGWAWYDVSNNSDVAVKSTSWAPSLQPMQGGAMLSITGVF